ncbi:uncharacterized protein LOC111701654 [Eurytemora carolleeae]|uniref:uncharacterized protein LOC111701654 n=1 Tax=Eurytemora carolleeae TaxID=1294199 RepID=UPI000C779BAE|nr:uncharacterized protein LOC111701654 [Eurytemora carolleeae]|eukprot:XP_023328810.1 uncharacterized protein LOC111701654 [Eurytemora affinis]
MMSADQSWILSSYYRDLEAAERNAGGGGNQETFFLPGYNPGAEFQGYRGTSAEDSYAANPQQNPSQQQQSRSSEQQTTRSSELRFSEFGGRELGSSEFRGREIGFEERANGSEFGGSSEFGGQDITSNQFGARDIGSPGTQEETAGRFLHHNIISAGTRSREDGKRTQQPEQRAQTTKRQTDAELAAECQRIVDRLYASLNQ